MCKRYRCACLLIAMVCVLASPAISGERRPAKGQPPGPPKPSENAGRTGIYQAKTSREGNNYFVYVPKSYSDDNPAGLHLFFHGQGGQGGAGGFGQWQNYFLEPYNLIGINMQYMDGDNLKDTPGKIASAWEAVQQVMADYKVLPRGAVASFSGGGLPHSGFYAKYGKRSQDAAGQTFPFNHMALYGSNFWGRSSGSDGSFSWFVGLGSEEWNMGQPTLGTTQPAKFNEVLKESLKGGSCDIYLKITKGKGHSISNEDVRDSAAQFHRSDLATCPFIYAADYREPELRPIVSAANRLQLSSAAASVGELLARQNLPDDLRAKALKLKERIDRRIDEVVTLMKELAATDAVLTSYYAPIFLKQLGSHPKAEEVKEAVASAGKDRNFSASLNAWSSFARSFERFFNGPKLNAEVAPMLEKFKGVAGEKALLGKMCTEFLMLQ